VLERLRLRSAATLPPLDADRETRRIWVEQRLGQGTFRSRVTDAYGRRCAVTGERTLPVQVSERIRDEYSNGRVYDELEGEPLIVLPERSDERPNRTFLEHHRSAVFRA